MMRGLDAHTGSSVTGLDHLRQSIRDILATPVGSRVMRREYGSRLYELIDAPSDRSTLLQLYAATAEALERWEPRFKLTRIQAETIQPGRITLTLEGEYLPEGRAVTLREIVV